MYDVKFHVFNNFQHHVKWNLIVNFTGYDIWRLGLFCIEKALIRQTSVQITPKPYRMFFKLVIFFHIIPSYGPMCTVDWRKRVCFAKLTHAKSEPLPAVVHCSVSHGAERAVVPARNVAWWNSSIRNKCSTMRALFACKRRQTAFGKS